MSDDKNTLDLLSNLSAREVKILKEKYGITDFSKSSLKKLGSQFDVTRERIREIEKKALKKLNSQNDPSDHDPDAA